MDGIWFLYLMLGAFPALIAFAAIYKYFEVVQASRWPSVPGRIVVSTTEARPVNSGGPRSDDTELRNFAKVLFEYKVATRTYRGDRVSISENLGNDEVAETVARYPVGKDVTVYYNPNRRDQALLERDAPPGLWKGATYVVLGTVVFIVVAVFGFKKLGALVEVDGPQYRARAVRGGLRRLRPRRGAIHLGFSTGRRAHADLADHSWANRLVRRP